MHLSLKPHRLPGRLVAVCGADGSGKTTAIAELAASLRARGADEPQVLVLRQPSMWWRSDPHVKSTVMLQGNAEKADRFALGIFAFADRLNQQVKIIEPALAEGKTVLLDRYAHCLIAYYCAFQEPNLHHLVSLCSLLFEPDFTFILDCSPEVSIGRVVKRDGNCPERSDQQADITTAFIEAYRALARSNQSHLLSSEKPAGVVVKEMIDQLK